MPSQIIVAFVSTGEMVQENDAHGQTVGLWLEVHRRGGFCLVLRNMYEP
jgi:hypothetical protein